MNKAKSFPSLANMNTAMSVFLLSVLLVVFWPSADKEFLLWDDEAVLSQYEHFLPVTWDSVAKLGTDTFGGEYMPITRAVWTLTILPMQWLGGSKWSSEHWVQPFILIGIFLHFLNCLLIKQILPLLFDRENQSENWRDWIPVFLYALHPLQVEGLAAISMLREPLWIFFGLLSIRAYLKKQLRPTFIFFLMATLSKPTSIVLIGFLLLIRIVKYRYQDSSRPKTIYYFSAMFAWAAMVGILAKSIQPTADFTTTFAQRILYSTDTLGFYLAKIVSPVNLAADYGRTYSWLIPQIWTSEMVLFFVIALITVILFWRRKSLRNEILFIATLFLLPLLPVSGVIPFVMQHYANVADHYSSFSIIAWAALFYLIKRSDYKINLALILFCIFYGWESFHQKNTWLNNETFAMQTLKINPRSSMAYNNVGLHWLRQGKDQNALEAFERSIELNPKVSNPYFNSVFILNKRGHFNESLALLEECRIKAGKSSSLYLSIANVYEEQGQIDKAIQTYDEAKLEFPNHAGIAFKLGQAYWKKNLFEKAIAEFKLAVQLEKGNGKYIQTLEKSEKLYEEIKKLQ